MLGQRFVDTGFILGRQRHDDGLNVEPVFGGDLGDRLIVPECVGQYIAIDSNGGCCDVDVDTSEPPESPPGADSGTDGVLDGVGLILSEPALLEQVGQNRVKAVRRFGRLAAVPRENRCRGSRVPALRIGPRSDLR